MDSVVKSIVELVYLCMYDCICIYSYEYVDCFYAFYAQTHGQISISMYV